MMQRFKKYIKAMIVWSLNQCVVLLEKATRRGLIYTKVSSSQFGEDIIVRDLLASLSINKPTYLDIGACHPAILNNTWTMYTHGSSGVLVEPNPVLHKILEHTRKRDVCLNVGVGEKPDMLDFYVMNAEMLSTFSLDEANKYVHKGYVIERVAQIAVLPVNEIIEKHCVVCPNFVSIDVEGLEMMILRNFDFTRYRPEVFCIETYSYANDAKEVEIIKYVQQQGYMLFADTHLNSIFVDRQKWNARKK